jgi:hypothetical protein
MPVVYDRFGTNGLKPLSVSFIILFVLCGSGTYTVPIVVVMATISKRRRNEILASFSISKRNELLIPELVKIEAKRTLLILHLRKIQAKRILFIPQKT